MTHVPLIIVSLFIPLSKTNHCSPSCTLSSPSHATKTVNHFKSLVYVRVSLWRLSPQQPSLNLAIPLLHVSKRSNEISSEITRPIPTAKLMYLHGHVAFNRVNVKPYYIFIALKCYKGVFGILLQLLRENSLVSIL